MRHELNLRLLAIIPATLLVAACAHRAPPPTEALLRESCAALAGQVVAAGELAQPSGAATVASARLMPASAGLPEHCRVLGAIAPRSASADPIRFQLNLPIPWNGKALMYGGGGFNGVLITGLAPLRDAPAGTPVPLTRGYATFGTDSGHDGTSYPTDPARFALDDEMFENFAFASYKKVKDEATRADGIEDIEKLVRHLAKIGAHLEVVMPATAGAVLAAVRENKKPENLFPRLQ